MKKTLLVLFIIFVINPFYSTAGKIPNGVAGLKWTDTVNDCINKGICNEKFVLKDPDGSITVMGLDELKVGPFISFGQIIRFDKKAKKLSHITLSFKGQEKKYKKILKALIDKYGSGETLAIPGSPTTKWDFGAITIHSIYSRKSDQIMLMYDKDWSISKLIDDL